MISWESSEESVSSFVGLLSPASDATARSD